MEILTIRGNKYHFNPTRDSFSRRAIQYANNIAATLKRLGIDPESVHVSEENSPLKKAPANVSWYIDGHHCHFSYDKVGRYVDNLQVVLKVVEHHVNEVLEERTPIEEFILGFKENPEFEKERKEAREYFGIGEDEKVDLKEVSNKYKLLAKDLHPDMDGGDVEKFKKLNQMHKVLKRELE